MSLRKAKQIVREYLKTDFSDVKLAKLLVHALNGETVWFSMDMCLVALSNNGTAQWCNRADNAYLELGSERPRMFGLWTPTSNTLRTRRLIPIIKAEMRRRALIEIAA